MNEIQGIKQRMNNMTNNGDMNDEQQRLKEWLDDKEKLPQYFELFISNGIGDLETASLLTKEGLKSMGIDIVGHQMRILHQVAKLKL